MGKAIKKLRDKVIITMKSPLKNIETHDDFDRILDELLCRLGTDHLDFYLLHGVSRQNWHEMTEMGVLDFLDKIQEDGWVKYVGFFFHDYVGILKDIINSYDWATCRVQHSYLGENCQAGKEGLRYAASEEIGVMIMEPLRGGRLTDKIPEEVQRVWDLTRQGRTPAEWGLGWV